MPVTLKEIAELAGVSESTVSRVLHNSRLISEKTREAVLEAARKLNYQTRHTLLVGVVEPKITNALYSEIVTAIEDQVYQAGYAMILCNSDFDLEREQDQVSFLLRLGGVQGMILIPIDTEAPHVRALAYQSLPTVLLGTNSTAGIDQINVDAAQGAYTMTRHLLELGHRRIGLLIGPDYILACRERLKGYCRALAEYHIPFEKTLVAAGEVDERGGVQAINQLLPLIPRQISAVLSISDSMTLGALFRLREVGIRVPEDLSLASCDDIPLASQTQPALTTLWQPKQELGALAAKLLLKQIETRAERGENWKTLYPFQSVTFQTHIVVRESTRKQTLSQGAPASSS